MQTILRDRTKSIGASEVAAIFGLDPRTSAYEVWARKRGIMPEKESTPEMARGLKLEAQIHIELAAMLEISPSDIEQQVFLAHPEFEFVTATLDFLLRSVPAAWEAKTTGHFTAKDWGPGPADVPPAAALQNTYQRALAKLVIGVEVSGGLLHYPVEKMEIQPFPLKYDAELGDMLIEGAVKFWKDHVETGVPPAVTGTTREAEAFKKLYAKATPGVIMVASEATDALVLDALESLKACTVADKEHERRCLLIKEAMADAEKLVLSDGRELVWKNSKGSVSWKNVASELNPSPELIAKHTPEVGPRPFNLKSLLGKDEDA